MKEKIQILKKFFKKFLIPNKSSSVFRWTATIVFSLLLFFIVVTVALVAVLRDREVQIPQRFANKILSEANILSSPYLIEASGFYLSLDTGFVPEIKISDVDLLFPDKKPVLFFNSLKTKFSLVDFILGKFRITSVTLDSANFSIIRRKNGSFNLNFGTENGSEDDYFDIKSILEKSDEFFILDELEKFQNLNLFQLTAQFEDELTNKRYTIDGARFRLNREDQSLILGFDFALLSGGKGASTVEGNFKRTIGQLDGEFGLLFFEVSAQDIANLSPEFGWLNVLEAPISGLLEDH